MARRRLEPAALALLVLVVVALAQPSPVASQASAVEPSACLSPLPGSDVYIRGTGKPVTNTVTVPLADFAPPFVLHVENGLDDGSRRVSSARILVDGAVVLGPQAFSPKVARHAVPLTLGPSVTLEVRVASAPGSVLRAWISGRSASIAPHEQVILGPEGGRYRLRGGIVLDVPPGAVTGPTPLAACATEGAVVDPILQSYGEPGKVYAGGLSTDVGGLVFDLPVTVTIPVRPRVRSTQIPVLMTVDVAAGLYSIGSTDLSYDPAASTVKLVTRSLRTLGLAEEAAAGILAPKPDASPESALQPPGPTAVSWMSRERGPSVDSPSPVPTGLGAAQDPTAEMTCVKTTTQQETVIAYVSADVQSANGQGVPDVDCTQEPAQSKDCHCNGTFGVKVTESEVSGSGGCYSVSSKLEVQYLSCPDAPLFTATTIEAELGTVLVSPTTLSVRACESETLAAVYCTPAGRKLKDSPINWSLDPEAGPGEAALNAVTGSTVTLASGLDGWSGHVVATGACRAQTRVSATTAAAVPERIRIDFAPKVILEGNAVGVTATVFAAENVSMSCADVTWSSSNPHVIRVGDPSVGNLEALMTGVAVLTATGTALNGPTSVTASVEIEVRGLTISIAPSRVIMPAGSTVVLSAALRDALGNTVPVAPEPGINWAVLAEGQAVLSDPVPSSNGVTATIHAKAAGTAEVWACLGPAGFSDPKAYACGRATIQVEGPKVCQSPGDCISPKPASFCLGPGYTVTLEVNPAWRVAGVSVGGEPTTITAGPNERGTMTVLTPVLAPGSYPVMIHLADGSSIVAATPITVDACASEWVLEGALSSTSERAPYTYVQRTCADGVDEAVTTSSRGSATIELRLVATEGLDGTWSARVEPRSLVAHRSSQTVVRNGYCAATCCSETIPCSGSGPYYNTVTATTEDRLGPEAEQDVVNAVIPWLSGLSGADGRPGLPLRNPIWKLTLPTISTVTKAGDANCPRLDLVLSPPETSETLTEFYLGYEQFFAADDASRTSFTSSYSYQTGAGGSSPGWTSSRVSIRKVR